MTFVSRKSLLAGVAMAGLVAALITLPIQAEAKCNPGRSNDNFNGFAGWYRQFAGTVGGSLANIYGYSPWVNYKNVSAWTMIDRTGTNNWAQIGWIEFPGNSRYLFDQWEHNGTYSTNYFNGSPAGQTHAYTVVFGNTHGYFTFRYDNVAIDLERADFTPDDAQQFGENQTSANQMAGANLSHEVFSNAQIYFSSWQSFSGTVSSNKAYYGASSSSTTHMETWDTYCST